jgi:hypothetical protein
MSACEKRVGLLSVEPWDDEIYQTTQDVIVLQDLGD